MSQLEEIKAQVEAATLHQVLDPSDCAEIAWESVTAASKLIAALETTLIFLDKLDRLDAELGTERGEDNISASGVAIIMRRSIEEALS